MSTPAQSEPGSDAALRRTVALVAALNLGYFGVEFAVAWSISSVSLFADSVDFLEDAAVNLLILVALGWSLRARSIVGMLLAGILLVPAAGALWMALLKLLQPSAPEPLPLTLTGLGALVVNLACAFMLARFRTGGGSLSSAAFLSARNDALANLGIIAAGLLTMALPSVWPDLLVGVGIAVLNVSAAREVWRAAMQERHGHAA